MLDPKAGAYRLEFAREFRIAQRVLAPFGGELVWATDDFVAFRYRDERACILFYPYKTSAGGSYLRVRSQASSNVRYAEELMLRLDAGAGDNFTFTRRLDNNALNQRQAFVFKHNIKPGWAAQGIR